MVQPTIMTLRLAEPDEVRSVVAATERHRQSGQGWVNLAPDFGDDGPRPPKPSWFSGRGPILPMVSLVPGKPTSNASGRPLMVGIEHGAGPTAIAKVTQAGLVLQPGWRVRQDHGRRGIVVEVAPASPVEPVLRWALAAAGELCSLRLPDVWAAEIWS